MAIRIEDIPIEILDCMGSVDTIVEVGSGYKTLDSIFLEAKTAIRWFRNNAILPKKGTVNMKDQMALPFD